MSKLFARKKTEKALKIALLEDGSMSQDLYQFELEQNLDYWRNSLQEDSDDYLLVVTENKGDIAMLLFEKNGELHVNEKARAKLRSYWVDSVYEKNMKTLIPMFAKELKAGIIPNLGFKTALTALTA